MSSNLKTGFGAVTAVGVGALITKAVDTIFGVGKKVANAKSNLAITSLASYTKGAQVEPMVIIDNQCLHLEYMPDVMQTTSALFTSYYVQAMAVLGNVGKINVMSRLDQLNPNRDPKLAQFILQQSQMAMSASADIIAGMEAHEENPQYDWKLPSFEAEVEVPQAQHINLTKDSLSMKEAINLAVGQTVNVEIKDAGEKAVFPVQVRMIPIPVTPSNFSRIISGAGVDKSLTERWWSVMSGRLDLINDLIFCRDLIREYKRDLIDDKEGVLQKIAQRNNNNRAASLITKQRSMAGASNIFIMTKETALDIRLKHSIDINKVGDRRRMFEQTSAIMMVVIDRDAERVKFFTDGQDTAADYGIREIKMSNGGSGPDLTDIFKAYKASENPTL